MANVQRSPVAQGTAVTTVAPVLPAGATAGNLLVLLAGVNENSGDVTWTDPGGWTAVNDVNQTNNVRQKIYYKVAAGGETTATITVSAARDLAAVMYEEAIPTATPLDKSATNTGNVSPVDSGTTAATTQAIEYWVGLLVSKGATNQTAPTNGFTQVDNVNTANATNAQKIRFCTYELRPSATGAANVQATIGSSQLWAGQIVCFKITIPTLTLNPTGIASAEAFGTTSVGMSVIATGIATGEAIGAPTIPKNRLTQSFEAGTNGSTISAANTAGSTDAFETPVIGGTSTLTFDNTRASRGTLSAKVVAASAQDVYLPWSALTYANRSDFYGRAYVYLPAYPSFTERVFRARQAGVLAAAINIGNTGILNLADATGGIVASSVGAIPTGAWVRLEWHMVLNLGGTAQIVARIFTIPHALTPTETVSTSIGAISSRSDADAYHFGLMSQGAFAESLSLDDVGLDTVGWLGPAITACEPSGIASSEAFGSPTITLGAISVSPTGLASAGAFGAPQVNVTILPTAISSGEVIGSPSIGFGVGVGGIASGELVGSPQVNLQTVPSGVASASAFGAPTVSAAMLLTVTGIASSEAFGAPVALASLVLNPTGIASAGALGVPSASAAWSSSPTGVASAGAFGSPTVTAAVAGAVTLGATLQGVGVITAATLVNRGLAVVAQGVGILAPLDVRLASPLAASLQGVGVVTANVRRIQGLAASLQGVASLTAEPLVRIAGLVFFLPPTDANYLHSPDRFVFLDEELTVVRTRANKGAYLMFMRTPRGLDENGKGGITVAGVDYAGGRWNGPLTLQQTLDLAAAGYTERLVTVPDMAHLPAGLD